MRRLILRAIILALTLVAAPVAAQKRIALSFDDVPRQRGAFFSPDERTRLLIAAMRRADVRQAAFFVTPGNLEKAGGAGGEKRIAAYAAAGHVIANHSFTHPHLGETTAPDYLSDVDRATGWLRARPGYRAWFRFPFLDEGGEDLAKREAVRTGLAARGLANGYVTVDGSDWNMEAQAVAAVQAGKAIDRKALGDLYVETMVQAADFYDTLARRVTGRSPAHMLLLHETDLAAMYLADLVAGLRADGWTIITADEAYRDPIAAALPRGPDINGTRVESLAATAGLAAPQWYERNNQQIANRLFAERVLKETPTQ